MKNNVNRTVIIVVILLFGFIYHFKYINEFPSHINAWAQSDRYALALGFLDNGLNFFKPQTFVYNHQFPDKWKVPSEKTITAVDFPIHDYIPALLMKITGNTSPWIFRLYILVYSFLGLFFLFKLSYAVTRDYLKSVFIVIFAASSPVYVYYQGGFLPTIPSLSNAIIGIFFYCLYLRENKNKYFWLSMVFLTLAALSRTTFAIPVFAVLVVEFHRILKKTSNLASVIIPVSISILSLLSYQLYNGYLRERYGSLFLNHILPAESIGQAKEIMKYVYDGWFFEYFTRPHYVIFMAIIVLSAYLIVIRKFSFQKIKTYFSLLTITYLIGCLIFAFLMLRQFPAHDYYFLDTFFLPIIMSVIIILSLIPAAKKKVLKIISAAAAGLISFILILQPIYSQERRRERDFWDRTEATINNFKNSKAFLDSLGISNSSKMLVIDAVAPNIPFILMQRKGFAVMNSSQENIKIALSWDHNYIVFQNEYFIPEIYTPYPGILSKLNKISDNGKISVCTLAANDGQSLLDFTGLNNKTPVVEKFVSFESKPDSIWHNLNPSDKHSISGNLSGYITPDIVYGLTYKTRHLPELKNKSRTLLFSSHFYRDQIVNCNIVVSIFSNGQNIYYMSYNLKDIMKQEGEWEQISLIYQLPEIQSDDYEFSLYLWNSGRSELYYDDFGFSLY